jgi:hypothetical protein
MALDDYYAIDRTDDQMVPQVAGIEPQVHYCGSSALWWIS